MFYNKAWTFDLSEAEKEAKRKLDRYGGLGYVDNKKAYRGLFTSGTLRLLLPYYEEGHPSEGGDDTANKPRVGDSAREWFQTVVVCEVNERSEPSACQVGKDVTFKTGGVNATEVAMLDTPGTLYLGKKICTYVRIPSDAKITSRESMLLEDPLLLLAEKKSLTEAIEANKTSIGLSLELSVHNHKIIARDKACSVSHVVWEQRTPGGLRLPLAPIPKEKQHEKQKKRESSIQATEQKEAPQRSASHAILHNGDNSDRHDKIRGDMAKPDPAKPALHDKLRGVHKSAHDAARTGLQLK